MPTPTRNYDSYVSSVRYSLKESTRFSTAETSKDTSFAITFATSGATTFTDPDGGITVQTDETSSNTLNDYTSQSSAHTVSNAIDGLAIGSIERGSGITGVTFAGATGLNGSNIKNNRSGNTNFFRSNSEDGNHFSTTFGSAYNTTYTLNNSASNFTFFSSKSGQSIRNFGTLGGLTGSTSYNNNTSHRSNGSQAIISGVEKAAFSYATGSGVTSRDGETIVSGQKTQVDFLRQGYKTLVVANNTPRTLLNRRSTLIDTVFGTGTLCTINTTVIEEDSVMGGLQIFSTISNYRNEATYLSTVTMGSDGGSGVFATSGSTNTSTEITAGVTGDTLQTSSTSFSGSNLSPVVDFLTYELETETYEIDLTETTTVSTEVSKVYNLPSSLSNEDTMKTYTTKYEYNSTTVSYEYHVPNSTTSDVDMVTSPYGYEYFEISDIIYEGGWGVFGFTETSTVGEMEFTTFESSDISTFFEINAESREVTTYSMSKSLDENTDTNYTEIIITEYINSENTDVGADVTYTDTLETTITTVNTDSPTSSIYHDHNFYDNTRRSYDTTTATRNLYIGSTSNNPFNNPVNIITQLKTLSQFAEDAIYSEVLTDITNEINATDTYWDNSTVQVLTSKKAGIYDTYTANSVRNIGIAFASVTKLFTSEIQGTNLLLSAIPTPSLITFSSAVLGIKYISDTTTEISDRENCTPPSVKYTYNFLTTSSESVGNQVVKFHVSSTKTADSYDIPLAQVFSLQGLRYLIRSDDVTVHDKNNNSITYRDDGGLSKESIATFTGTYTTVSTLFSETASATETYSATKKFYTIFKNEDEALSTDAITTYKSTQIFQTTYDDFGMSILNTSSSQFYFGGCKHFNSLGSVYVKLSNKFTLVDANNTDDTTEMSSNLEVSNFDSTNSSELDSGLRYFISTRTEFIGGKGSIIAGGYMNTSTYKRESTRPSYGYY